MNARARRGLGFIVALSVAAACGGPRDTAPMATQPPPPKGAIVWSSIDWTTSRQKVDAFDVALLEAVVRGPSGFVGVGWADRSPDRNGRRRRRGSGPTTRPWAGVGTFGH